MYNKVLVAVDGSKISIKATQHAAAIASKTGATITLFHVVTPLPSSIQSTVYEKQLIDAILDNGKDILEMAKNDLNSIDLAVDTEMVLGEPSFEICQKAKEGDFDLVVIGSRGLGELSGFIMGSISRRVVRHLHCPVLVVR